MFFFVLFCIFTARQYKLHMNFEAAGDAYSGYI